MGRLEVELKKSPSLNVNLTSSSPLDVNLGPGGGGVAIRDYEKLKNLPQINNVTLIGNLFLGDLFPDGIIINGGDSTGYDPIPIPSEVPHAEGVGF